MLNKIWGPAAALLLSLLPAGSVEVAAHEVTVENRSGRTVYVTSTMQERGRPAYTWYAGWIAPNQARADLDHYAGWRLFVVRGTNGRVLASRLIHVNRDMTIRVVTLYSLGVDLEVVPKDDEE